MSDEPIVKGHPEIDPANCPRCGTKITTVTKGRTTERGPILAPTLNCGHTIDKYAVKWIEDGGK